MAIITLSYTLYHTRHHIHLDHKKLNLNLNSIIDILNNSKRFCFFEGLSPFAVATVLFSRLWVYSSYFFIENPPSHIDFGVLQKRTETETEMTESIVQPDPCMYDFCMFVIILVKIDAHHQCHFY